MITQRLWFTFTLVTMAAWGLWGALIDTTARAGFPETLGYVVWALTMVVPALIVLGKNRWKLEHDRRSVLLGCTVGLLGAGGQLILFKVLRIAPAYLVFPFIALSPLVTIVLALVISKERTSARGWAGVFLALVAGVLLSWSSPDGERGSGLIWAIPALLVLIAWGVQGFVISHANKSMRAESIFFYMTATALLLIPVALAMTDFRQPINWGMKGPPLAAAIQVLNSVGALLLVYAFRYGKAIIVAPLINAGAPVVTVIVSLLLYQALPGVITGAGMVAAIVAATLMALAEDSSTATPPSDSHPGGPAAMPRRPEETVT
jgi:drug/metabolite transporter (DMT)-like permease